MALGRHHARGCWVDPSCVVLEDADAYEALPEALPILCALEQADAES